MKNQSKNILVCHRQIVSIKSMLRKLTLVFLISFWTVGVFASAKKPAPNIVFILMDDMGWTDLGCYGSKFYKSPNIDRLASQGMKFTQAYAACPVCSPTRASIMTGKYPARLHITDWLPGRTDRPDQKLARPRIEQQLPLEEITIAEALKSAGYVCGAFGKWHLGGKGFFPTDQGFDKFSTGDARGRSPGSQDDEKGEFGLTENALEFINDNKGKSFFLYLPYYSVHIPLGARRELVEKYEKRMESAASHTNAIYAAMIESVDAQIGRILARLDELKLSDNTVVIFTSDNGGVHVREYKGMKATNNKPLRAGKGFLYEGGIRVPLIVRWPGVIKSGSRCDAPVVSVDYYPTLLEIVGEKIPAKRIVDGKSILPLLKQTGSAKQRQIFWHYPHYANQGGPPGGAIRDGDFKLIEFYEDNHRELYNLRDDLSEHHDLAKENPRKTKELAKKLDAWRRGVGAQMMTLNPNHDPSLKRSVLDD
jgi:arylsulfatase A